MFNKLKITIMEKKLTDKQVAEDYVLTLERQYPNNLNDLELAELFIKTFTEQYQSSLENNAGGFTLEFCDDDDTPFCGFVIEGDDYYKLGKDEEFYKQTLTEFTTTFVAAYKVKYQYA